jgi:hypothetical protein
MSLFKGPDNNNNEKVYQYLDNPVSARYIRFYPVNWNQHISMRAGVLIQKNAGPNTKIASDYLLDNPAEDARSYSSVWGNNAIGTWHARSMLDSPQAWSALRNDGNQWMTIDLGSIKAVGGVVTQCRATGSWDGQRVTYFKIGHSTDGTNFALVQPDYSSERFGNPIHYRSVFRPDACVDNAAGGQGTQMTVWECGDTNVNQKIVRGPNNSIIMSNTGMCMDVAVASQENGGLVHQWPCHGGANQQWTYNTADKTIRPRHAPNKCLDVLGFNRANGAKLGIWDCWGGSNQQWFEDEIKLPNPYSHLPLPERCTAYENLIKSSKNKREQDRYKIIYGEECMPEYQNRVERCNQKKDRDIIEQGQNRDKCHKELKTCVKEFQAKTKGTIEAAWYGPLNGGKDNTYNVKTMLEKLQKSGKKQLKVNSYNMGGDPARGQTKFLFINYRTPVGEFRKYKIPENGVFNLEFPHTNIGLGQKGGFQEGANQKGGFQEGANQKGGFQEGANQKGASFVGGPSIPQQQHRSLGMGRSRSQSGAGFFSNSCSSKMIQSAGAPKNPIDKSPYCTEWANRNPSECVVNENYMNTTCPKSCDDYRLNTVDKTKPPEPVPSNIGADPLDDYSEYAFQRHRDFPALMKEYVPNDACDDIANYVLKSDVIETHQKALKIISEIKALDSINRRPISRHPQYQQTMDRFALRQGDGSYRSCQLCPGK